MNEGLIYKIWRVIYPALLLFFVYFVVYIIAILTYGSFFSDRFADTDAFMAYAGDLISIIALTAGGAVSYLFYRKESSDEHSGVIKKPLRLLAVFLMGIFASHALSITVSLINMSADIGSYQQTEQMLSTSGIFITILKTVILAPLAEETAFRGLIYGRMRRYGMGFWLSAVISSLLFALYHMNLLQGIYAFIFGILLCLIYKKYGSLIMPMLMHAASNALSVVMQCTGFDYPSVTVYIIVMILTYGLSAAIYFLWIRKN